MTGESAGKLTLTEFEPAHWQYQDNPFCGGLAPFIQVLLRDGEVVAHMGAFPLLHAARTTAAPEAARVMAILRPMPRPAPVTMATRS